MRLALLLIMLLSAATGCSPPSAEEVQAEFDGFVASRRACQRDEDCGLISPGCPLGCFTAVNVRSVKEAEALARELIDDYESAGRACEYGCIAQCGARCAEQTCEVVTECSF